MRYLVVRKQNAPTARQFKLLAPIITIGRTSENSIALKDGTISRQHCAIETRKGVTRIRDLGSFHGFQINNKQAREAILKHGDCVVLGTYELYYIVRDDEPDPLVEGGVTQNRASAATAASPAAPGRAAEVGHGAATGGGDDDEDIGAAMLATPALDAAAGPMDSEAVEEHDFPEAARSRPAAPDGKPPIIDDGPEVDEGSIFDIEMKSGDFPIQRTQRPAAEDDNLDLNAIVREKTAGPTRPASKPAAKPAAPPARSAAPTAPAAKAAAAAPPAPAPGPAAAPPRPDPRLVEAEAQAKQLQHELGVVLKAHEATKATLKKALEELEVEKLKSATAARKYLHMASKADTQEKELADAKEKVHAMHAEAVQHLKDYNELDGRLQDAVRQRGEFEQQAIRTDIALKGSEDARADDRKRIADLTKANEELTAEVQKLHAQFSTVRKKMATLETNLNTVQESRLRAKNVASTMEKERDDLRRQLDAISTERDSHHTRTIRLEQELNAALQDHAAAAGRVAEVQKSAVSRDDRVRELEDELSAARDTITDLEEEIEAQRAELEDKLSTSAARVANLDEEKIKRKLGAMEKERRQALATADAARKQLASAHQQAVVLQSFLDEREVLIKKLRDRLRQYETGDIENPAAPGQGRTNGD